MDLHRIGGRNSPKQAKIEIIHRNNPLSLHIYLSWDLCVSSWDREIEMKTMTLRQNRETKRSGLIDWVRRGIN